MSEFKMRSRPKKPKAPNYVSFDVGNSISISELLECIEEFEVQNSDREPTSTVVEAEETEYGGATIYLVSPPSSQVGFESKLEEYREKLKEYETWRVKNKKEIEKYKKEQKKLVAKRKLERSKERLTKELVEVKARLSKV